ncbi:MAG: TIGR03546 family protein [Oligoflexia bacterium]|jgi:uncharacterized protein (TIGR03546 family)
MTLLLKQIFSLIKLLNSDKDSGQISAGIVCGMILGFSPAFSLQTVLVILILFFFRIQIGAATLAAFFFAIPAWLLDPAFDWVGSRILEAASLRETWTTLYHLPLIPLTRFNHSTVMGAGVVAVVLAPVVYLASNRLISQYREKIVTRFEGTKFWKALKATRFYNWYVSYEAYRGE